MNASPPTGWMATVTKAAWTLLLVAAVAFVVWQILRPLLPVLVVIVGLVFVIRLAIGWFHRDGW